MADGVEKLVMLVVLFVLVAQLAPTALTGLFNTTLFSGVPTWVPTVLGIIGVVGFIFIMLHAAKGHK